MGGGQGRGSRREGGQETAGVMGAVKVREGRGKQERVRRSGKETRSKSELRKALARRGKRLEKAFVSFIH